MTPRTLSTELDALLRATFPHSSDYTEVGDTLVRSRVWETSDLGGVSPQELERIGLAFGHARRLWRVLNEPKGDPFPRGENVMVESSPKPDFKVRETATRLRQVYAERYPEAADIRRLLKLAGLDYSRVMLMGAPYIMWDSALEEARKMGKLETLYDVIRKESPSLV